MVLHGGSLAPGLRIGLRDGTVDLHCPGIFNCGGAAGGTGVMGASRRVGRLHSISNRSLGRRAPVAACQMDGSFGLAGRRVVDGFSLQAVPVRGREERAVLG